MVWSDLTLGPLLQGQTKIAKLMTRIYGWKYAMSCFNHVLSGDTLRKTQYLVHLVNLHPDSGVIASSNIVASPVMEEMNDKD